MGQHGARDKAEHHAMLHMGWQGGRIAAQPTLSHACRIRRLLCGELCNRAQSIRSACLHTDRHQTSHDILVSQHCAAFEEASWMMSEHLRTANFKHDIMNYIAAGPGC